MSSRRLRSGRVACGSAAWLLLASLTAQAQDAFVDHAEIVSQFNPEGATGGTVYMDIWGYTAPDGTELVLLGGYDSVYFVNVTAPERPRVVMQAFEAPSTHRDMRTWGHYAYSVNETNSGMQIYDLSDPLHPRWVATYDSTFSRAHNIGIYEGTAYIAGSRQENTNVGMRILDLADPVHPVEVGAYTEHYVHDVFVRDDVAYVSNINDSEVSVLDVSDKSNPITIASIPVGDAVHQSWLTDDSRYLLTTQENVGGHLRIWDVQDLQNPVQVSAWRTTFGNDPNDATIHNVFVRGDTAYASYYAEGLQVIDISDIFNPHRVAQVDTRPTQSSGFKGMWGVYPFARSGLVFGSDMIYGLYVVRLTDQGPQSDFLIQPPAPVTVAAGAGEVQLYFDVFNGGPFEEDFTVQLSNSEGWHMVHATTLHVRKQSTESLPVSVTVPPGQSGDTILQLELCLTSLVSGATACASTQDDTAVLLQDLSIHETPQGLPRLQWRVAREEGDGQELLVLRRSGDGPGSWRTLERVVWQAQQWTDREPLAGEADYALGHAATGAVQILAQVHWKAPLPPVAQLFGNVPNPFNPHTAIRFRLQRPGDVEVRILDVRGRLVRVLRAPVTHTGLASIPWDGRDARQVPLASGRYPYVISSGRWRARGSMTLLR